jgi:hypothetical protein
MLIILGIAGIFQAILIPGIIILNFLNLKLRLDRYCIIIFGLSIAFNSNLVFLLSILNIYTQKNIIIIFIAELLIYLIQVSKNNIKFIITNNIFKNLNFDKNYSLLYILGYLIVALILFITIIGPVGISGLGGVFIFCDAVVSWNRWAIELATGSMPFNTAGYPQLLPAILSIPYVFMNDSWIQFFSVAISLSFASVLLLTSFSIYDKYPGPSLISAILFFLWPINKYSHYLGYADLPVMTVGFMSIATIIWSANDNLKDTKIKLLLISFVLVGASAALKQAGLLFILFFPLIMVELYYNKKILTYKFFIYYILIISFIVIPWYAYNQYLIMTNQTVSVVNWVTEGIHENRSLFARLFRVLTTWPGIFIATILSIPGLLISGNRAISLFAISYILTWGLFFSYDMRNAYFALPFLCFSIGLSSEKAFSLIKYGKMKHFYKDKNYFYFKIFILIIISFLTVICILKSDDIKAKLYIRQNRKVIAINSSNKDNNYIINLSKEDNIFFITNDLSTKYLTYDLRNKTDLLTLDKQISNNYDKIDLLFKKYANYNLYLYLNRDTNMELVPIDRLNIEAVYEKDGYIYKVINH